MLTPSRFSRPVGSPDGGFSSRILEGVSMLPPSLDTLEILHLEALIANGVAESRVLEYKQALPAGRDADKREFLADVSSFANAGGGDIIFGMAANEGVASGLVGLPNCNVDDEINRLESMVRDGIVPRIQGLRLRSIAADKRDPVIVIRVPQSWCGPRFSTPSKVPIDYHQSLASALPEEATHQAEP